MQIKIICDAQKIVPTNKPLQNMKPLWRSENSENDINIQVIKA